MAADDDKQSRTTSGKERSPGQSGSDAQPKENPPSVQPGDNPQVTTASPPEAIPAGLPVKVAVGVAASQQREITAPVSQHLTVDEDGRPINFSNKPAARNLMPGDDITLQLREMESLARAGYVLDVDPSDPVQMRALLAG